MTARAEKVLAAVVLTIVTRMLFVALARWSGAHDTASPPWMALPIDAAIPVLPMAVWAYLSWYAAPLLIFWAELWEFRRVIVAVLLAFLACSAGWLLVPAAIERPQLAPSAALSLHALRGLYQIDPPTNLFPSFHAALAAIIARTPLGPPVMRWMTRGWMVAICFGCVLTKQHYVLDVAAGIIVGVGAVVSVDRWIPVVTEGLRRGSWAGGDSLQPVVAPSNFPNLCGLGACGCAPSASHQVQLCQCGDSRCFDGNACVGR